MLTIGTNAWVNKSFFLYLKCQTLQFTQTHLFCANLKYGLMFLLHFQVPDSELSKMTSLSSIQTKGLKRQFAEEDWLAKMSEAGTEIEKVIVNKDYGELTKKNKIHLQIFVH